MLGAEPRIFLIAPSFPAKRISQCLNAGYFGVTQTWVYILVLPLVAGFVILATCFLSLCPFICTMVLWWLISNTVIIDSFPPVCTCHCPIKRWALFFRPLESGLTMTAVTNGYNRSDTVAFWVLVSMKTGNLCLSHLNNLLWRKTSAI